MDELLASREEINRSAANFLKIDLQTALTFVKIARTTGDDSRKRRNCRAARKAYSTVAKLVPKVSLNAEDSRIVRQGLAELKNALDALGDEF